MEAAKGFIELIEVPHEPGLSYTQLFLSVRLFSIHLLVDRVIMTSSSFSVE